MLKGCYFTAKLGLYDSAPKVSYFSLSCNMLSIFATLFHTDCSCSYVHLFNINVSP